MRIELLWFEGCPNHVQARRALEDVLVSRGLDPAEIRLIRVDEGSAEAVKFPGSPTIRVDGRDIEPGFEDAGRYSMSCRVYQTPSGLGGTPPVEWIEHAIDQAANRDG